MTGHSWREPLGSKVFSLRVYSFDQPFFLLAPPALDLLLSRDRILHFIEALLINEADGAVLVRESFEVMVLVFEDALAKIAGHSRVERTTRCALYHVNVVAMLAVHAFKLS